MQVDKTAKGSQKSFSHLSFTSALDPGDSFASSLTSNELGGAFLACMTNGFFVEATTLGEELITRVLGNKSPDHLELLFAVISMLQSLHISQIEKLLHLQHMNPQLIENFAMQQSRFLEKSYERARIIPQAQVFEA